MAREEQRVIRTLLLEQVEVGGKLEAINYR